VFAGAPVELRLMSPLGVHFSEAEEADRSIEAINLRGTGHQYHCQKRPTVEAKDT
jgi:hypothetical protein